MDTETLKSLIKDIIADYARFTPPGDVEAEAVTDYARGNYELSYIGRNRTRLSTGR